MKPYKHAQISAKKFGGIPEDYLEIHTWFDHTKGHIADMRHRALLHNAWGIWLCESIFGELIVMPDGTPKRTSYITNSAGKKVQVRDIGEQHVLDDMGRIPSVNEAMEELPMLNWLGGPIRKRTVVKLSDIKHLLDQGDERVAD